MLGRSEKGPANLSWFQSDFWDRGLGMRTLKKHLAFILCQELESGFCPHLACLSQRQGLTTCRESCVFGISFINGIYHSCPPPPILLHAQNNRKMMPLNALSSSERALSSECNLNQLKAETSWWGRGEVDDKWMIDR